MGSLSLSRVTSVWAYTLAELQPVPQDKLSVLLQVCGSPGDAAAGPAGDAGTLLQKIMPLTMFLEKARDKVCLCVGVCARGLWVCSCGGSSI